jgi:dihydrolipoamide dehydrogenase
MQEFDVVVIGSGPGGYVSAIRCAQLGLKTAIVERYSTLGGTCLNVGCIPSKALLDSSERYFNTVHSHADHGIMVSNVQLDMDQFMQRVRKVVSQTCDGIGYLMKKNKITVFHGHGTLVSANEVAIKGENSEVIRSKNIILATGSKPSTLPGINIDKKRVITSTEALKLFEVPKHLVIIGGGVIGLELGSVYARLGAKVSVVEYADSIIPSMDNDLTKELSKVLKKEGFKFYTSTAVESVGAMGDEVKVFAKDVKKGTPVEIVGDYCLVAVGRKAYTENLGLADVGIKVNEKTGKIQVDNELKTNIPNIYAIGDVVDGPMLAHKAEEEGVFVAEKIVGQIPHIHYHLIPGVVYTWPEVASVGKTEKECQNEAIPFKKGSFPFKASGRARASNEFFGLIKVLAHSETDEILGVHMIGPRAADMIAQAVTAMEFKASAEDIARICHPHPTYSEAFKEACLAATENRALHI